MHWQETDAVRWPHLPALGADPDCRHRALTWLITTMTENVLSTHRAAIACPVAVLQVSLLVQPPPRDSALHPTGSFRDLRKDSPELTASQVRGRASARNQAGALSSVCVPATERFYIGSSDGG